MAAQSQDSSLYELLEIGSNATIDEIESSYSRIVAYLDADALAIYSMVDEEEVARLRSHVDAAFRTLSDPDRRAEYDRFMGGSSSSYPSLLVPESHTGTSVSMGRVQDDNQEARQPALPAPTEKPSVAEPEPPSTPARQPVTSARQPVTSARQPVTSARQPAASARQPAAAAPVESSGARPRRLRLKPTLDIELTPDTEFSGALLKRLRESADATLDDVAEITKISKHYLRSLENNDFDALPAAVYVRGFISEYARSMGLDAPMVTSSFMRLFERYKTGEGE